MQVLEPLYERRLSWAVDMSQTEDTLVAPPRVRLSRRTVVVLAVLAVVVAAVVVALATGVFGGGGAASNSVIDNTYPTGVASVTRQSLASQTQVSGTLTYAGSASVVVPAGTAPSALAQAQQAVTTAEGMLAGGHRDARGGQPCARPAPGEPHGRPCEGGGGLRRGRAPPRVRAAARPRAAAPVRGPARATSRPCRATSRA